MSKPTYHRIIGERSGFLSSPPDLRLPLLIYSLIFLGVFIVQVHFLPWIFKLVVVSIC